MVFKNFCFSLNLKGIMNSFSSNLTPLLVVCRACCKSNVSKVPCSNQIRLYSSPAGMTRTWETVKTVREMQKEKKSRITPLGIALLSVPITAFGLGTWQIFRKFEKEEMINELKKRTTLEPVKLPENLNELKSMEYHPVRVKGRFDHSREIYVGPRAMVPEKPENFKGMGLLSSSSNPGFLVITPFILSDRNLTILVNRGWVPSANKSPELRPAGQVSGEVELVGLVRHSEPRQPLGMKNAPEKGFWQYRDIEKFAEYAKTSPIMIDAVKSTTIPGGPIAGQTVVGLRNEHITYILTWYTLGFATVFMWMTKYMF